MISSETRGNRVVTVLMSAILSIIACVAFVNKFKHGENTHRCIMVNGKSEREIIADTAEWIVCFEYSDEKKENISKNGIDEKNRIISFLKSKGIDENEIEFHNYSYVKHGKNKENAEIKNRTISYCYCIKTTKTDLVAQLKNDISELLQPDMEITKNRLMFKCSKYDELEHELYKEAVLNAINKANDISKHIGVKLKKIIKIEAPKFSGPPMSHGCCFAEHHCKCGCNHGGCNQNGMFAGPIKNRKIIANVDLQIGIK
jgi:hypothetical protein